MRKNLGVVNFELFLRDSSVYLPFQAQQKYQLQYSSAIVIDSEIIYQLVITFGPQMKFTPLFQKMGIILQSYSIANLYN